jgi:O-acetylhomoserine/O-acetylserine sulfhydrylase-like pyridoxal-dependent enzyme
MPYHSRDTEGVKMTHRTLEERVDALEDAVTALATVVGKQKKDWKCTVGMFEGDAVIAEIQEEGRKIREAERREERLGPES